MPHSEISFDIIYAVPFRKDAQIRNTDYSSIQQQGMHVAKHHACYYPSSHEYIKDAFKAAFTNRLANSISNNLLQPIKNRFGNYTTKKIWEEDAANLQEAMKIVRPHLTLHKLGKDLNRKGNETKVPVDLSSLTDEAQRYLQSVLDGAPLGKA